MKLEWRELRYVAGGIIGANVAAAAVLGLLALVNHTLLLSTSRYSSGLQSGLDCVSIGSFWLLPVGMGMVAAFLWRSVQLGRWEYSAIQLCDHSGHTAWGLLCSSRGYRLPVDRLAPDFPFTTSRAHCSGARFFAQDRNRLNLVVLPVVLLASVAENGIPADGDGVVVDRIADRRAAGQIWQHVVAFPRISAPRTIG